MLGPKRDDGAAGSPRRLMAVAVGQVGNPTACTILELGVAGTLAPGHGRLGVRVGAGVVVPHPETEVRGMHHAVSDYILGGPVAVAGLGFQHIVGGRVLLAVEGQVIAGRATVTVDGGRVELGAFGLHGLGGIGYRF